MLGTGTGDWLLFPRFFLGQLHLRGVELLRSLGRAIAVHFGRHGFVPFRRGALPVRRGQLQASGLLVEVAQGAPAQSDPNPCAGDALVRFSSASSYLPSLK